MDSRHPTHTKKEEENMVRKHAESHFHWYKVKTVFPLYRKNSFEFAIFLKYSVYISEENVKIKSIIDYYITVIDSNNVSRLGGLVGRALAPSVEGRGSKT